MTNLKDKLRGQGYAFEFFQAVRLLENLHPEAPPVGGHGPYSDEAVRLRPSRSLAFPAGDVQRIETSDEGPKERWLVTQNFMGLYGVNSPLPPYFAEMIAQAYSDSDPLRDFMDIFNHRLASLYYRAWSKHHPAASCDPREPDRLTMALCAMIGQEPGAPSDDWAVAPQRLVRYAGLLAGRTRSPAGLEALLADYFGLERVRVAPFLPKKVRLQSGDRNRLGARGRNNRLGRDLVLGKWVLDAAGFFRLSLGPLSLRNFQKLQPGRQAFNELVFLVNFFTRRQLEFELELILDRDQVKPFVLSAKWNLNPLGRYSWLGEPQSRTVSARLEPNET